MGVEFQECEHNGYQYICANKEGWAQIVIHFRKGKWVAVDDGEMDSTDLRAIADKLDELNGVKG